MPESPATSAVALRRAEQVLEQVLAEVRAALEIQALEGAGERPVPLERAAHELGVSPRHLRRFAAQPGCGTKIRGKWLIFMSRIVVSR